MPQDVFDRLLNSATFCRAWADDPRDYIHGPYDAGVLTVEDFERTEGEAAKHSIVAALTGAASWMDRPDPPGAEASAEVDSLLARIPEESTAWRIKVDPWIDRERVALGAFYLWEFNESIFVNTRNGTGYFTVIGMD
jgi:hypothetical protein